MRCRCVSAKPGCRRIPTARCAHAAARSRATSTTPRSAAAPDLRSPCRREPRGNPVGAARSEEHTSELQSLMRISYAVFCLKKKKHDDTENETRPQSRDKNHQ